MDWQRINAVQRMQEYIVSHLDEDISPEQLASAAGYSVFHSIRMFRELTGKTPGEFQRALKLTDAAKQLRDEEKRVLDVALDSGFSSHEGFTRAFFRQFRIKPKEYSDKKPPVSYFTYYPIQEAYRHAEKEKGEQEMKKENPNVVTVQAVDRPERKLIILRAKNATDYWSYCEELGCEWEGYFNSVKEKFDTAALLELPDHLVVPGTSPFVSGIEVPMSYEKELPEKYDVLTLPPVKMLYFKSLPYEREEDYSEMIDLVIEAVENYNPKDFGFRFVFEKAPKFNFGATAAMGAKYAVPVEEI